MDDEFARQLMARVQAMEFPVQALIRHALHQSTPADAAQTIAQLERQFAQVTVPPDADPTADLDAVLAMHRDAQHFLSRMLHQAAPKDPDAAA